MINKFSVINFVVFQLCWFTAAIYQQTGLFIMMSLLIVHFVLSPTKNNDIKVLLLAFLGCIVDQVLFMLNVFEFTTNSPVIPMWLILLWCSLVLSLNHSLRWLLNTSVYIKLLLGAVLGPSSYFAALSFGALNTQLSSVTFIIFLAIVWSCLLPVLCFVHQYFLFPKKVVSTSIEL